MSVLIKNMEIPKQCGGCPLRSSCKQRIYIEYRSDDCPMVEIPTPHGRLVDADELKNDMRDWNPSIIAVVDAMPTVIEAEGREE